MVSTTLVDAYHASHPRRSSKRNVFSNAHLCSKPPTPPPHPLAPHRRSSLCPALCPSRPPPPEPLFCSSIHSSAGDEMSITRRGGGAEEKVRYRQQRQEVRCRQQPDKQEKGTDKQDVDVGVSLAMLYSCSRLLPRWADRRNTQEKRTQKITHPHTRTRLTATSRPAAPLRSFHARTRARPA